MTKIILQLSTNHTILSLRFFSVFFSFFPAEKSSGLVVGIWHKCTVPRARTEDVHFRCRSDTTRYIPRSPRIVYPYAI